ncbi:MAG: hypothetical protein Q8R12_05345 [bacterium]|nr:hypothetical protein [bacterium]
MKFRQALFWDTNPKNIDVKKHAPYIIERVLDLGTDSEVRWLWRTYPKLLLRRVVGRSRSLRPRTKTLWTHMLK